jgi:hypothetical protein
VTRDIVPRLGQRSDKEVSDMGRVLEQLGRRQSMELRADRLIG